MRRPKKYVRRIAKGLSKVGLVGLLSATIGLGSLSYAASEELDEKRYRESKITFFSYRDGNNEIYVMNIDGSGQTNLTSNPAGDGFPSWSPDGKKVAFVSNRDGNPEIYVINTDGSEVKRLTTNPAFDVGPSWSPDGKKIAFSSDRDRPGKGKDEIYVMNADGSGQQRLTMNPASDTRPVWSPFIRTEK